MAKTAKATSVSATFGYDTMTVSGFSLYTIKLRVKQFDLLRCILEHKRRKLGELPNINMRLVPSKNGNMYAYYEFVTTDYKADCLMRSQIDDARAEVKDIEATRLRRQVPFYMPDYLVEMQWTLRREEIRDENRSSYARSADDFDLPF